MIQKWQIIHWPTGKQIQLCSSEEVARKLLPSHGKNHIMREVFFYDEGELAKISDSKSERVLWP